MDSFVSNGPHIVVDTTEFDNVDFDGVIKQVENYQGKLI